MARKKLFGLPQEVWLGIAAILVIILVAFFAGSQASSLKTQVALVSSVAPTQPYSEPEPLGECECKCKTLNPLTYLCKDLKRSTSLGITNLFILPLPIPEVAFECDNWIHLPYGEKAVSNQDCKNAESARFSCGGYQLLEGELSAERPATSSDGRFVECRIYPE